MAAEIEAIRGVAASDAGVGNVLRASDSANSPGTPERRLRSPEAARHTASPEVGLVFEVDRESHDLVIKIVDRETHKVIREIPPEEVRSLRAAMQSMLGALLDRTG